MNACGLWYYPNHSTKTTYIKHDRLSVYTVCYDSSDEDFDGFTREDIGIADY